VKTEQELVRNIKKRKVYQRKVLKMVYKLHQQDELGSKQGVRKSGKLDALVTPGLSSYPHTSQVTEEIEDEVKVPSRMNSDLADAGATLVPVK
jgi:predicted RND superfamily exporter protein